MAFRATDLDTRRVRTAWARDYWTAGTMSIRNQSASDDVSGRPVPERVYDIFGLCCVYDQGHVDIARTVIDNARSLSTHYRTCATLTRLFRRFRPDLVITDFEPFSAMLGRLRYGVPVVSLDNQHMLTHCACDHLTRHNTQRLLHYLAAYGVIRLFFGGAKRYLITTFAQSACAVPPHHARTARAASGRL